MTSEQVKKDYLPTPREQQLLKLSSQGFTDKEIATILGLRLNTVSTYWKRLKEKYPASNRTSLVISLLESLAPKADSEVSPTTVPPNETKEFSHGIILTDVSDRILFLSQSVNKVLSDGLGLRELTAGATYTEYLRQNKHLFLEGEAHVAWTLRVAQAGAPVQRHLVKLSTHAQLEIEYVPLYFEGRLTGHLWQYGHFEDKEAEAAGQQSNASWVDVIANNPIPRIILDQDLCIKYLNAASEDAFGVPNEQACGMSIYKLHQAFATTWLMELFTGANLPTYAQGNLEGMQGWYKVHFTCWCGMKFLEIKDETIEHNSLDDVMEYAHLSEAICTLLPGLVGGTPETLRSELLRLVAGMAKFMQAERAAVFLIDPNSGETDAVVAWRSGLCRPPTKLSFHRMDPFYGWWRDHLDRDTPTIVNIDESADEKGHNFEILRRAGTRMLFLLPIRQFDATIGFVQIEAKGTMRAISGRSEHLLLTVACCILGSLRRMLLVVIPMYLFMTVLGFLITLPTL